MVLNLEFEDRISQCSSEQAHNAQYGGALIGLKFISGIIKLRMGVVSRRNTKNRRFIEKKDRLMT